MMFFGNNPGSIIKNLIKKIELFIWGKEKLIIIVILVLAGLFLVSCKNVEVDPKTSIIKQIFTSKKQLWGVVPK